MDMLARGASPYDVAKLLGDTVGDNREALCTIREGAAQSRTALHGKRRRSGEDFWHDLDTVTGRHAKIAMKTK